MKYSIEQVAISETKDVDISRFLPTAKEKVIITIRRLPTKKRNDMLAIMSMARRVTLENDTLKVSEAEMENTAWYNEARMVEVLHGVVQNETFPFKEWNRKFIEKIDALNPDLITLIQDEIQLFNLPLAQRKKRT